MFKKLEIWQKAVDLIKKIYKYAEILPKEVQCILLICEQLEYFKVDENILNEMQSLGKQINSLYNKLIKDE